MPPKVSNSLSVEDCVPIPVMILSCVPLTTTSLDVVTVTEWTKVVQTAQDLADGFFHLCPLHVTKAVVLVIPNRFHLDEHNTTAVVLISSDNDAIRDRTALPGLRLPITIEMKNIITAWKRHGVLPRLLFNEHMV